MEPSHGKEEEKRYDEGQTLYHIKKWRARLTRAVPRQVPYLERPVMAASDHAVVAQKFGCHHFSAVPSVRMLKQITNNLKMEPFPVRRSLSGPSIPPPPWNNGIGTKKCITRWFISFRRLLNVTSNFLQCSNVQTGSETKAWPATATACDLCSLEISKVASSSSCVSTRFNI